MSGLESEDHEAAIRQVEKSQRELSQALGNLEDVVRSGFDPATWITERPLPWLLGGLFVGLWLGIKR